MTIRLVWATPDDEKHIMYCARVSYPKNQDSGDTKLLKYCMKHGHWSVFEMASMCVEIKTTRAIARQILRHKSFSFQEFSTRYAEVEDAPIWQETRLQDTKNRQNSISDGVPDGLAAGFLVAQREVWEKAMKEYKRALKEGVAKEQARALLPEGLAPSTMYMSGTLRSWIHYTDLRCENGTQKEHQVIAKECRKILETILPAIKGDKL